MKKILVPTDFSDQAYMAAEVAASIAKKTGARVYLLHVINMPSYEGNGFSGEYQDIAEGLYVLKMTKKKFKELREQPFFKGVNLAEVLQFDNVYETIAAQAKEHDIDLIVMGTHGSSGLNEIFVGSNTEKVVRLANMPVLSVKSTIHNFKINNLVFASNFYEEAEYSFDKIQTIAEIFDSTIHLLKVITPEHFENTSYSKKLIMDFVKRFHLKKYTVNIYNHRNLEEGILEFSNDLMADIISINTHGRTGFSRLINGSIAEGITNHSNIPVLSQRLIEPKSKEGVLFPDEK
jgi:nucleotide-binding universal stress UspA family protein